MITIVDSVRVEKRYDGHGIGFLGDWRGLNMAISRAKVGRITIAGREIMSKERPSKGVKASGDLLEIHLEL
jgi:superfamily I DNA and/or RNA helicase